ncbi:GPW/gp25 family protein [Pseudoalteromonas rubra]|uniref:GPW/gp25 family protein n=1 Tax=Pseudoalteromonas rubra TaxID=43658 RepID=UPI000F7B66DD|nr:phage baseplate protein [Pseudoalteromonas rubra]
MLGIDRETGRAIEGVEQLASRITQVLTTPVGGRVKRPQFGSDVRRYLGANLTDGTLMRIQAAALQALYKKVNGVTDFKVSRCIPVRHDDGCKLYFEGVWQNTPVNLEVPLNATPPQSVT